MVLLAAIVAVVGTTTCPAPADVERQLATLLAPASPVDRAELTTVGTALQIELRGPRGERLATRMLEPQPNCGDLAKAAAVVIATWEMELRPGLAEPIALPAERPAPPAPPPAPRAAGVESQPARPIVSVGGSSGVEIFVGGMATTSFSGLAPGGVLGLYGALGDGPLAVRATVMGSAPEVRSFGPGNVKWTDPSLTLGGSYRPTFRTRWILELHADLVAAVLAVWADGYVRSSGKIDFDPGAMAGVRVGHRFGSMNAFADGSGLVWFRKRDVQIDNLPGSVGLARGALLVSVGLGWTL